MMYTPYGSWPYRWQGAQPLLSLGLGAYLDGMQALSGYALQQHEAQRAQAMQQQQRDIHATPPHILKAELPWLYQQMLGLPASLLPRRAHEPRPQEDTILREPPPVDDGRLLRPLLVPVDSARFLRDASDD